ncbi:MAG: NAD(P)/FAD-dependent oxidoreductase [Sphingomonadales bacterium]|nr:NAD(P)/FAD-dependent oxidoreductase [Sphingomonadales bacterium]
MVNEVIATDAVVIGAGPIGLFTVFELGLLGIKCHVIDNLDRAGGQCTQLYPEKPIFDIPSRPRCTGQELTDDLLEQASPFEPVYHFNDQVQELWRQDNGRWRVLTAAGLAFEAPLVVVAAGAGSFVPKRPPIAGIEAYEDNSVFYAVRRMEAFRDKKVVIVGGGDSALDWVLSLQPLAASLTLVHRREEFRAAPDSVERMKALVAAGKMRLVTGTIGSLIGADGQLSAVTVKLKAGGEETLPCNALLPFFGLKINLGPLAEWGLTFEHTRILVDPGTFATNLPGIYAVGDICTYPGKLKLILSGFHEAAVMAHAAFHVVRPNEKIVAGYTTTNSELQRRLGVEAE